MKKIITLLLTITFVFSASAQLRWNSLYQTYISQYKDLAIEEMLKHKIPASITLAQGLLESCAGQSELVKKGNNHFGIKCHDWTGRKTYHDDDAKNECFRAYKSAKDSYEDHSQFLKRTRYKQLFSLPLTDYRGWARGLKACGYATDPGYATKLINVIELYKLYRYDSATDYDKFFIKHAGNYQPGNDNTRLHPIYKYNDNYYLRARRGDTFKSLAEELELSEKSLAKANERSKYDVLREGEIIYLKKKRKHAEKQFKNRPHVVKAGESMYDISQKYGIRVKSLYKLNDLPEDYQIKVGVVLRVY
ncbi:glucosaminidase domain-containing protein [Hoylesella shahii]|jgi:family 4 N-acetylmuramoyl-L-alanine amidase|uniref:Peptidoglycan hydrolase n=1 Tax=Hoylesella shahii DSM 15611 = JCM 12083 TaxID=1122991 RepID=A0A318HSL5_9BACT|nr:glucosaminidase domain-containing protein [Hoylesella shahii]PXX21153.1 flagellum-specific peptidoglycan hydrolase FlgJ [Hoylesella shahii DSM 15611 = JCM 12083]